MSLLQDVLRTQTLESLDKQLGAHSDRGPNGRSTPQGDRDEDDDELVNVVSCVFAIIRLLVLTGCRSLSLVLRRNPDRVHALAPVRTRRLVEAEDRALSNLSPLSNRARQTLCGPSPLTSRNASSPNSLSATSLVARACRGGGTRARR